MNTRRFMTDSPSLSALELRRAERESHHLCKPFEGDWSREHTRPCAHAAATWALCTGVLSSRHVVRIHDIRAVHRRAPRERILSGAEDRPGLRRGLTSK